MHKKASIELYSYQKRVIEAIKADPSHSQLISMPTGTGKTITFLSAIKEFDKNCLILVHREELLRQTYDKARLLGYEEQDISLVTAQKKEEFKKLNIAMVQTLSRNLESYPANIIDILVIDEAHHALSPSYLNLIKHFEIFEKEKLILGFTATPLRGDKKALSQVFLSHSFKMTLAEATQNGYICPVYGIRVDIDKGLEQIEQVSGDYDISKLDKVMNCDEVNDLIADKCQYLQKTPCLVFCTSVDHAQNISDRLRKRKRKAISVSYKTSKKTLAIIFRMLKEGRIDFITNAVKLSEGFDHPAIQTIVLARPTRSPVLYKQIIGRGLRKFPGKVDCSVIEFSGNDPKKICWEDIDENCTFQTISASERKSREEAINIYTNKFKAGNIKILDVRISPFSFYECCIRRTFKPLPRFYCCPFTEGFFICEIIMDGKADGNYGNIFGSMFMWQKLYQIFYLWDEGRIQLNPKPDLLPHLEKFGFLPYCKINDLKKWYPSEEELINGSQKAHAKRLGMKTNFKTNARKFEMELEEFSIRKAIKDYIKDWRISGIMTI